MKNQTESIGIKRPCWGMMFTDKETKECRNYTIPKDSPAGLLIKLLPGPAGAGNLLHLDCTSENFLEILLQYPTLYPCEVMPPLKKKVDL